MYMPILLSINVLLFVIGLIIVLIKKSIIFIIIGIELILQAAISNFILFNSQYPTQVQGQVLIVFCTAISICEIILVIAVSLRLYKHYKTIDLAQIELLTAQSEI
jgi:NADH-quinone oxidoreductase subunit K